MEGVSEDLQRGHRGGLLEVRAAAAPAARASPPMRARAFSSRVILMASTSTPCMFAQPVSGCISTRRRVVSLHISR